MDKILSKFLVFQDQGLPLRKADILEKCILNYRKRVPNSNQLPILEKYQTMTFIDFDSQQKINKFIKKKKKKRAVAK